MLQCYQWFQSYLAGQRQYVRTGSYASFPTMVACIWCTAWSASNTMLPGPRPTIVPSGILILLAVWPQQTWVENSGLCPLFGEGELGPHLAQLYVALAEAYLHTKWHLDPSNRLATIHQRTCNGRPKTAQWNTSFNDLVKCVGLDVVKKVCVIMLRCWSYVGFTGYLNQTVSIGDGCQSVSLLECLHLFRAVVELIRRSVMTAERLATREVASSTSGRSAVR